MVIAGLHDRQAYRSVVPFRGLVQVKVVQDAARVVEQLPIPVFRHVAMAKLVIPNVQDAAEHAPRIGRSPVILVDVPGAYFGLDAQAGSLRPDRVVHQVGALAHFVRENDAVRCDLAGVYLATGQDLGNRPVRRGTLGRLGKIGFQRLDLLLHRAPACAIPPHVCGGRRQRGVVVRAHDTPSAAATDGMRSGR